MAFLLVPHKSNPNSNLVFDKSELLFFRTNLHPSQPIPTLVFHFKGKDHPITVEYANEEERDEVYNFLLRVFV